MLQVPSFSHTVVLKCVCLCVCVCACLCVCVGGTLPLPRAQMWCPCLQDVLVHAGVSEPADSAAASPCMRTCWIISLLLPRFSCCCWQTQKKMFFWSEIQQISLNLFQRGQFSWVCGGFSAILTCSAFLEILMCPFYTLEKQAERCHGNCCAF